MKREIDLKRIRLRTRLYVYNEMIERCNKQIASALKAQENPDKHEKAKIHLDGVISANKRAIKYCKNKIDKANKKLGERFVD